MAITFVNKPAALPVKAPADDHTGLLTDPQPSPPTQPAPTTPSPEHFVPSEDDYYDGMSCLVKSIRLREVYGSLYWLTHLCTHHPSKRYLIARRVLTSGGEDGVFGNLHAFVALKFKEAMANLKGSPEAFLSPLADAVHAITSTPNWWSLPEFNKAFPIWNRVFKIRGTPNSVSGLPIQQLASRIKPLPPEEKFGVLVAHYFASKLSPVQYATLLHPFTKPSTRETIDVITTFPKELARDQNYLLWGLARASLIPADQLDFPSLKTKASPTAVELALQEVKNPHSPPACFLDGVHTKNGSDKRFAGILDRMIGLSRCFLETGAVTRHSEIPPEWCSDVGLASALKFTLPNKV